MSYNCSIKSRCPGHYLNQTKKGRKEVTWVVHNQNVRDSCRQRTPCDHDGRVELRTKNEERIRVDGEAGKRIRERMRTYQFNVTKSVKQTGYEDVTGSVEDECIADLCSSSV
jgi:hypothetical protein